MNLYLIRHGQTFGNRDGIVQGWGGVDLTDEGKAHALMAKKNIEELTFKKIFASDLQRAKTTAKIIFGEDADIVYDERLRELDNTVFEGRRADELTKEYGDHFLKCRRDLDYSYFGGESGIHLMARAADFLNYLGKYSLDNGYEDENFVAVTHFGIIHAMISFILQSRLNAKELMISNGSVTLLKCENRVWSIQFVNYTGDLCDESSDFLA